MSTTWYVYLLECADGTYYTGITTDLARRVAEHNAARVGAKYTKARRPVSLRWSEPAADRSAASRREWEIKQLSRVEKQHLMK